MTTKPFCACQTMAMAALMTGLSLPASAQSSCSSTAKAITLTSTPGIPMTEVDINWAIRKASGTTVIKLSGPFEIYHSVVIPVGKSCLTLQGPSASTPATLTWSNQPDVKELLLLSRAGHDITLRNLTLEGRGVMLISAADGTANYTIDQVNFVNPHYSDPTPSNWNFILRLISPTAQAIPTKGWTITNSTFTTVPGLDGHEVYTNAIMGYSADNVTITNNTFTNIDEAIHYRGLSNARINNNKGTGIYRSAIEIQEGFGANDASIIYKTRAVEVSGNSFTQWRPSKEEVLGLSLANGEGFTVTNNTLLYQGADLASCQASPALDGDHWGIEFSGVNSKATGNTICGFQWGIRMSFLGSATPYTGTDITLVEGNTLSNIGLTAITMFSAASQAFATDPQTHQLLHYTETPAQAHARWTAFAEGPERQLIVRNNTITNARISGFCGGASWLDGSPVKMPDGRLQKLQRFPLNAASHLAALTIEGNKISRTFGFFPTDTVASGTPWNDLRFTGLEVPAIRNAKQLKVSGNSIALLASPANARAGFVFKGITADPLLSVDDGKNYSPAKTFNGSVLSGNVVTASPNPYGIGVAAADTLEDTWKGINVTGNKFSKLAKGIDSQNRNWVRTGVAGNTCANVLQPGVGCNN